MYRVFVYGTLKSGQPNHFRLQDASKGKAIFVGAGETEKEFPLVVASRCNLPFLLNAEGTGKIVRGEVYDVDQAMLHHLDILEFHPALYRREDVQIVVNNGKSKCLAYFLHSFKPELLELPFLESFDSHSLQKEKTYVPPNERNEDTAEHFWEDVKLPDHYISPHEFYAHMDSLTW